MNEQIRQNAEEYASKLVERDYHEDIWLDLYDAFMSGAHSRDEEVSKLEKALHNVNEWCRQLRNKLYELRHPWISVEERPKKTDVYYVRTRQGCADMAYFDSSITKWEKGRFADGTVTHWMPIPDFPNGHNSKEDSRRV